MRIMMLTACLCLALGTMLVGCADQNAETGDAGGTGESAGAEEPVSREFFAMDTYMTVSAYGEHAAEATEAAEEEVMRLDAQLSTGNADSEISKLNNEGKAVLSPEAGALVERGLALYEETGQRFDIAIYPLMKAWGFTDKKYRVPSEEELKDLLPLTDPAGVKVQKDAGDDAAGVEVSFAKDGMAIDLGGLAKGYTSSRIMEIYKEYGISSGLANLGGNVQMLGTKPDGSNWRVAVRNPNTPEESEVQYLGLLEAADTAVISSGGYERFFTQDGIVYHHIIDPATGYPADSGLKSVTIVCEDGTQADALSTSLFIMGKDQAIEYWREHADQFNCILMDQDNELFVTEPIADQFSSDLYHVTVVK